MTDGDVGERVDRWLARRLDQPRNQIRRWLIDKRVQVNGRSAKAATLLRQGDIVSCSPPEAPSDPGLEPQPGELDILHKDPDLVVIDKAAGIAVHPGAGRASGTVANFLLDRFPEIASVGGAGRPGIVHRLDLDTTGALVVARSARAYQRLAADFAERRIRKTYLAIAYGTPRENPGRIELPIGRHRHHRKQMQVRRDGRPAVTRYVTQASSTGISRLEIDLETGRTHQIRIHLKAIRHPLVGDPVYGEARWRNLPRPANKALRQFARPALHAWRLAFAHPVTGDELTVEAPIPEDLLRLWQDVTGEAWPP
ncbi:MAG: RluA family pseudouridine synthase [Acidobacteriota bacterium]